MKHKYRYVRLGLFMGLLSCYTAFLSSCAHTRQISNVGPSTISGASIGEQLPYNQPDMKIIYQRGPMNLCNKVTLGCLGITFLGVSGVIGYYVRHALLATGMWNASMPSMLNETLSN